MIALSRLDTIERRLDDLIITQGDLKTFITEQGLSLEWGKFINDRNADRTISVDLTDS